MHSVENEHKNEHENEHENEHDNEHEKLNIKLAITHYSVVTLYCTTQPKPKSSQWHAQPSQV